MLPSPREVLTRWSSHGNRCFTDREGSLNDSQVLETFERYVKIFTAVLSPERRRVLFAMRNTNQHALILLALLQCDALVFPTQSHATTEFLQSVVGRVQPHLMVGPSRIQANIGAPLRDLGEGTYFAPLGEVPSGILDPIERDAAIGIFSSGSTGEPKAILHRAFSVWLNAQLHAESVELLSADAVGMLLPLSFSYGLVAGLFASLLQGCSIYFYRSDAPDAFSFLAHHKISFLGLTPFGAQTILGKMQLSSLRTLTIGGDSCHTALASHLLETHPHATLFATYGLSEAGPRVSTLRVSRHHCAPEFTILPLGEPLRGVETFSSESDGELLVRTPTVMLGYYRDPIQTAHLLSPSNHVLSTQDLVRSVNGQRYLVGRKKRLIIRGGEKVHPAAIEKALRNTGLIENVWVDPESHTELGQVPVAYVVGDREWLRTAPAEVETRSQILTQALRKTLPGSYLPQNFYFVDALPEHARVK